jgi:flavin-dependent dehydrogenase
MPEAVVPLSRLGATRVLDPREHLTSPGIVAAWGSSEPHENDFIFSPYGSGWHLDRRRFDEALARSAADAGARLIPAARPFACGRGPGGTWHVVIATGDGTVEVTTHWVVDATGRAAWFARRLGTRRYAFDRLVGLVGLVDDPAPSDPRTFIEAAEDGWWYVAALPGGRSVVIFFTDADLDEARPNAAGPLWLRRLASARLIADRLSTARRAGPLRSVSAASTLADRVVGDGGLAIGDAACTLDPLSSQGIGWAITAGLEAARVILDPDLPGAAARYADGLRARYGDYLSTRRAYYDRERRWPGSPFWQRRACSPSTRKGAM